VWGKIGDAYTGGLSMVVTVRAEMARNDLQVKIDAEVVKLAKQVSLARDLHLAEYLSELLRPLVMRDHEEEMKKQGYVPAGKKPKGG
jgi:hypothetical protein